jgi:hypothetical protein
MAETSFSKDKMKVVLFEGVHASAVDAYCTGEPFGAAAQRAGVAAVPGSSFFGDPAAGRDIIRFTFCKKESTLAAADCSTAPCISVTSADISRRFNRDAVLTRRMSMSATNARRSKQ